MNSASEKMKKKDHKRLKNTIFYQDDFHQKVFNFFVQNTLSKSFEAFTLQGTTIFQQTCSLIKC